MGISAEVALAAANEYTDKAIQGGGGGGSLPEHSIADAGKVLRVGTTGQLEWAKINVTFAQVPVNVEGALISTTAQEVTS